MALRLGVLVFVVCPMALGRDDYSMREELLKLDDPLVVQYSSPAWGHPELQDAAARDYARMGFNGVQHGYSLGTRLRYGTFLSVHCTQPPPVQMTLRKADGSTFQKWIHFGDIYAPTNVDFVADYIIGTIRENGENSFTKLGGRFIAITADEADLQYSHALLHMVSPHREAAWRNWLAARYGDATPREDTNGDGRTYAADAAGEAPATWDAVPIPALDARYDEPRIWIAFRQFICDHLYDFVQQVEDRVNENGLPFAWGFSGHASIAWPGGSASSGGADYFLQGTRSRVLAVENTNARWPWQMDMNYAIYDRMSRRYDAPVFGWSWFWPTHSEEYNWGSYRTTDIDRIFGQLYAHEVHGLLYWVYVQTFDRLRPEFQRIAFWHHWYRRHWNFLKRTHPSEPQVAILHPKTTALFYEAYAYPKQDYGWTLQALHDLQIPFTILTEEEIARDGVGGYRALLVPSAERVPQAVANAIEAYIADGGHVYADADSLTLDETGRPLALLRRCFGVEPVRKRKVRFQPSLLDAADARWAADPEAPLAAKTPYGAAQEALDETEKQLVDMRIPWARPTLQTWHDIVTARAPTGVLATCRGEPVAVETDRTLWLGFRLGADLCATYPHDRMRATGEPMSAHWDTQIRSAAARAPYVDLLGRFLTKAGVQPLVPVTRDGELARNIDVYTRVHEVNGAVLAILVETDLEMTGASDRYRLTCPFVQDGFVAWDLTVNEPLPWAAPKAVDVRVPEHGVAYVLMGPPPVVQAQAAIQRALLALHLRPEPLPLGARGGPDEGPAPQPRLVAAETAELPAGLVARLRVEVRNPLAEPSIAEPVVLSGSLLTGLLAPGSVKGLRLQAGPCQWDDLDGDGALSAADEIAWQTDLAASERKTFILDLLPTPNEPAAAPGFTMDIRVAAVDVVRDGRLCFAANEKAEWDLSRVVLPQGTPLRLGAAPGFVFGLGHAREDQGSRMAWQATEAVADGPVRKRFRVRWGCDDPVIVSTATYTLYAQQPPGETRIYAGAVHEVKEHLDLGRAPVSAAAIDADRGAVQNHPDVVQATRYWEHQVTHCHGAGGLLCLPYRLGRLRYEDAMGRVCEGGGVALFANNCGGWIAREGRDGAIQVSLRRVKGVLSGPLLRDESDGLQVPVWCDYPLVRAAYSYSQTDDELFDDVIPAGSRWTLDTLITLAEGYEADACRLRRRQFAAGLDVAVTLLHGGL